MCWLARPQSGQMFIAPRCPTYLQLRRSAIFLLQQYYAPTELREFVGIVLYKYFVPPGTTSHQRTIAHFCYPAAMTELTLELDEQPKPEDFRFIVGAVRGFNRAQTGNDPPRQVAYFLRDEERRILGGVQGSLWGRSVHIDALWIDESLRGRGFGSQLMKAIEAYGGAHAHPLVYLETASFQALPFYRALGYEVFGELPEISKGETLFFLKKELQC